jgi:hypothetical protein
MNKSCQFQIKNGKLSIKIEHVENLLSYYQEYNLIENNTRLIVETDILIKQSGKDLEKLIHKTLIILSGFKHGNFEVEDVVESLMFNLRHNIFNKIKLELGIKSNKYLFQYFPEDSQFSCAFNKNLKFDDYNFTPVFNPNLLVDISY